MLPYKQWSCVRDWQCKSGHHPGQSDESPASAARISINTNSANDYTFLLII